MAGLVLLADRAVLRVAGEGAANFLHGICTQDVLRLAAPGAAAAAAPAAFLSPRGRVLCDAILVARGEREVLLDCHRSVAKSLLRLLLRHRLREPLAVEDVSGTTAVVAQLPTEAPAPPPAGFFRDPRFAALGHRAVLGRDDTEALPAGGADVADYHRWRVCCAVPEGPGDLPADTVLPLHANLDLLNFVSFSKGCYVGQELTTRTKHRGAVRRRVFSAVAASGGDPAALLEGLGVAVGSGAPLAERARPLPLAAAEDAGAALPGLQVAAAPAQQPGEDERSVHTKKPDSDKWQSSGALMSAANNVGLCLLRCDGSYNHRENFTDQEPLAAGAAVKAASGAPLLMRAPPYAFVEEEE